jgi:threonine dehydratase
MPTGTIITSRADIERAATRIQPWVLRTPLLESARLSDELGVRILVKAENLQHTGSFKVRGVFNALLGLRERDALPVGVTTFSAGNHAMAVSYAARALGIRAVVCMPHNAVAAKVEGVRRHGGDIVFTADLLADCQAISAERGYPVLHPFDDPDVIAGQGTVGLEVLVDCPETDLVVVPVGGGGLISGVASAVAPGVRVVGAEPHKANAMTHALRLGRPDPLPERPVSVADGLTAPFAGVRTLAHVQELVAAVVEVGEQDIHDAW